MVIFHSFLYVYQRLQLDFFNDLPASFRKETREFYLLTCWGEAGTINQGLSPKWGVFTGVLRRFLKARFEKA